MDARISALETSVTGLNGTLDQMRLMLESGTVPGVTEQVPSYMALIHTVNEGVAKQVQVTEQIQQIQDKITDVVNRADTALKENATAIGLVKDETGQALNKADQMFQQVQEASLQDREIMRKIMEEGETRLQNSTTALSEQQRHLVEAAKARFDEVQGGAEAVKARTSEVVTELNRRVLQVEAILGKLDEAIERTPGELRTGMERKPYVREIGEYKAVSNLVSIPEDKKHWNWWVDRFKCVVVQARGDLWKAALDAIDLHNIKEDYEELVSTSELWDQWVHSKFPELDVDRFKREIYFVLNDKVNVNLTHLAKKFGTNGIRQYKAIQKWSTDITEMAKQDRYTAVMRPNPAKSDAELADRIEVWDQERRDLRLIDEEYDLKGKTLMTAFRCLLTPTIRDYVDVHMQEQGFSDVKTKVMEWAIRLKREKDKVQGINALGDIPTHLPGEQDPEQYQGNGSEDWYWDPYTGQYLAAVGKGGKKGGGKGSGKNNNRTCFNCGKPGHIAAQCRSPKGGGKGGGKSGAAPPASGGKGGGKAGKGQFRPFTGSCYGCGKPGRTFKYCACNPNKIPFPGRRVGMVEEGTGEGQSENHNGQYEAQNGQGAAPVLAQVNTMDFGGAMAEEDLKRHFEDMGWSVTKNRGKAGNYMVTSRKPNISGPSFWKPEHEGPWLLPLDGRKPTPPATLNPVVQRAGNTWRKVSMSVDSGAIDTVVPPDAFPGEVVPTLATQSGFVYYGAEGTEIPHMGEQDIQGRNKNGRGFKMKAQVAPVTKPLCAVNKMLSAGNRVVFDSEPDSVSGPNGPACYILNKTTGEITPMENRGGDFQLDLYIPVNGGSVQGAQHLAAVNEGPREVTYTGEEWREFATFLRHV